MKPIVKGSAWAYLVVSDPQQADTLADQEAWANDAARTNGWVITRTVSGVSSGKLGARGLSLEMIEDLESADQRPERLLMIRLERLGRGNGLEAMEAFLRIRRLGIVVHTRLDGDVGYDRASELLMPVLRFFIGGMENEVRRDKLNAMYARRRKARETDPTLAVATKLPYGLRVQDGHLVPKPPEDGAVRLAYELRVQGYGCHTVAKRLAKVAPPMTLKDGRELPQHWTANRVRRLIGKALYRGTIVDESIWLRAQQPANGVTWRPTIRYEHPLGGALHCECGYALVGHKGPGRATSTFRYYQCRNYELHGSMKHHRSDRLEAQFLELLGRLVADDTLIDSYLSAKRPDTNVEALKSQIATLRAEHARVDGRRRQIFAAYEDGSLEKRDLQWRLDDLRQTQANLEARIEAMDREIAGARILKATKNDVKSLVASASDLWLQAPIDDKRALARAIGDAFGGFVVTLDGKLSLDPQRKIRPRNPPRG